MKTLIYVIAFFTITFKITFIIVTIETDKFDQFQNLSSFVQTVSSGSEKIAFLIANLVRQFQLG